ncbi:MAG: thioredoxin domain-containing protein [Bryobacteraceae bacterium]|nr:thioredoxin domain-containing protein [Bryobacteraceae bacterium]
MKSINAAAVAAVFLFWPAHGQAPKKAAPKTPARPAARAAATPAFNAAAFEAYVRHLLLWNDKINVKVSPLKAGPMPGYSEVTATGSFGNVSLDEGFYVSNDGAKIVRGSVYDINQSPFVREQAMLKDLKDPYMGTPGAPVTLVAFSDYQCGYCKEEAKSIRENLLKAYPKEVVYYFREFPLDQIHPWARAASIAGRCVHAANAAAYWGFHDWAFDKQQEIRVENFKPKFMEWAQAKSLDTIQLGRCLDSKATEPAINRNVADARTLRVTSTPTLFVNGRPLPGSLAWNQLKVIIDWELKHAKDAAAEADECCSISLPTPLPAKK